MLPDISLDEEDFEEILREAREKCIRVYPQWTDFNAHDPGVTMLELFAMLKESQQFFADRIGAENQKKYLKLLGIYRRKKQSARSCIRIEAKEDYCLLQGHKLDAGTLCFETTCQKQLVKGDIGSGWAVCDNQIQEHIDREQILFGNSLRFHALGREPIPGSMLYLCFDGALPVESWLDLYIEVYADEDMHRNPLADGSFVPFVQLEWEYYTGTVWKQIKKVQDETYGFLFHGFIHFWLPEAMERGTVLGQRGYFIRGVLQEGQYDMAPVLTRISMNICQVLQKETLVERKVVQGAKKQIELHTELAVLGVSEVYLGKGELWYPVSEYEKEICTQAGTVQMTIHDKRLPQADRVMIINRDVSSLFQRIIGRGNGFPYQEIHISDLQVEYESFEILIQESGEEGYRFWQKVEDFSNSTENDRHYIFDSMEGILRFGDIRHGMAPEGNLILAGYVRTMGSNGNIKTGSIHQFRMEGLETMVVSNICDGIGGCDEERLEESFLRARNHVHERECAVTKQDYEKFTAQTPGLMIESCKVLSMEEIRQFIKNACETAIYVVVKPYGSKLGSRARECYARGIERYLESRRMLGNQVCVLFPEYVDMDVYVEVLVKPQYLHIENHVRHAVQAFFRPYRETFGSVIAYSKLYGFLEKQDFVMEVRSLNIDTRGNGVKRNAEGDVILSPYGIAVLKEVKSFLVLS